MRNSEGELRIANCELWVADFGGSTAVTLASRVLRLASRVSRLASRASHVTARLKNGSFLLVLCALPALALALTLPAQDLHVTSRADRTRLRIGENLVYTLVISGAGAALPARPSSVAGFKSVGQYVTPEPGGSGLAYHYLLTPTQAGHLEVDDFSLRIAGADLCREGFRQMLKPAPQELGPRPTELRLRRPPPQWGRTCCSWGRSLPPASTRASPLSIRSTCSPAGPSGAGNGQVS